MMKTKARGVQCLRKRQGIGAKDAYHEASALYPDNFQKQLTMIRDWYSTFLYPEDPEYVKEKFRAMNKTQLKRLAREPSVYARGTTERAITYRLRVMFGDEAKEISIFNPGDDDDSSLGHPIGKWSFTEEDIAAWNTLMSEEDDDY